MIWDLLCAVLWPDQGQLVLATGAEILYSLAVFAVTTAISLAISALTAPNIKGPRQKDQATQGSDYGVPIRRLWGPRNRCFGNIIWQGPLVESKRKRSGSGGSTTTYHYSRSCAVLIGQGVPGATLLRIWANKKVIWDRGEGSYADDIRFYDGNDTQLPDPAIELDKGVGNVPGYRHSMYVVIDTLDLAGLGPPLPYFEFEVQAHAEINVDQVVAEIGNLAGTTIDVSMLDGNVGILDGYNFASEISAADALQPLCAFYYFDIGERRGELVAIPRGMDPVATIPIGDTGAVQSGNVPEQPEHKRAPDSELPQEVAVTYRDIDRDLQPMTQRAKRNLGNARENVTVDFNLAADGNQARRVAHRLLNGALLRRRSVKTTVTDRWLDVLPGDNLRFPTPALTYLPYRLEKSTRGANNVTEWELGYEDAEIYNCAVIGGSSSPTTPPATAGPVGATRWVPMDTPIVRNEHDNAGFYWVGSGSVVQWRGFILNRSVDGGVNWEAVGEVTGGSTIGTVSAVVPSGPTHVWDLSTEIVVTLLQENLELESLSRLAVYNGGNLAWIGPASGVGGEFVQFLEAELIAAKTYRLTVLLRGRRGTEWAAGRHGASELFVLMTDSANLKRQDYGAADFDASRLYKPVSVGVSIDDTTAQAFTNTGEAQRPWSPAQLVGRRDTTGGIDIQWNRRTRLLAGGFGTPCPLGEEIEDYTLEFYEPADEWAAGESYDEGDVRRFEKTDYSWGWFTAGSDHVASTTNAPLAAATVWTELGALSSARITDTSGFYYTADHQIEDGHTPGTPVMIQCRQRNALRGLGHPTLAVAS